MQEVLEFCKREQILCFETSALNKDGIGKLLFSSILELPQFEQYMNEKEQLLVELGNS